MGLSTILTKCINRILILTDNIENYDEVCLLCNKIEFAVFNITERYCTLVSVEETVKARRLVKEQELRAQETLNLFKSFLENTDNASLAKSQNSAIDQFFETPKFNIKSSKIMLPEVSVGSKFSSKSSKSSPVHPTLR